MQGHLRIINSGKDMDNCFNNFFCQKILNIHDDLTSITLTHGMPLVEKSCMPIIHTFEHIAETDIRQLLKRYCDIMVSTDQGKLVLNVLLDLSAGFDKVYHNVPFPRTLPESVC